MNKDNLEKKLIEAGMSEAEAAVYLVLLESPSMTIQEVTNNSGLPRSTVILALEKFSRTGVIDEYVHGKRRNFVLRSPQMIENYSNEDIKRLEKQKALLGNLVVDVRKLHFLGVAMGAEVEVLKGENGLKDLYKRTLTTKKGGEILRLGVDVKKFFFIPDFLKHYSLEKNKKGIKTRLLIPESEMAKEVQRRDKEDMRETRLLPKKFYNPDAAIAIWGENLSLTVWDENLETIMVHSKQLVDIFVSIFELLWKNAKK